MNPHCPITKNFLDYLLNSREVSQKTLKNYKSDLKHFTLWLLMRVRILGASADNLTEAIPYLSSSFAREYKAQLVSSNYPSRTINRRLATLRHLSRFLQDQTLIPHDFASNITNVMLNPHIRKIEPKAQPDHFMEWLMNSFEEHLTKEKISHTTIKNYLSDIRHFSNWLKTNG